MSEFVGLPLAGKQGVIVVSVDAAGDLILDGAGNPVIKTLQVSAANGTANTAIASFPHTLATHTAAGAGTAYNLPNGKTAVQASSAAAHTGTSTIDIEISNDNVLWKWILRLTVTGNSATDMGSVDEPYAYIRSNCTAHGDSTNAVTVTINQ